MKLILLTSKLKSNQSLTIPHSPSPTKKNNVVMDVFNSSLIVFRVALPGNGLFVLELGHSEVALGLQARKNRFKVCLAFVPGPMMLIVICMTILTTSVKMV